MNNNPIKGLRTLAFTNFVVFILFLIPFLLTKNFWFLTASIINLLGVFFLFFLIARFNKTINKDGQK